jgi:hypothetical protein
MCLFTLDIRGCASILRLTTQRHLKMALLVYEE